MEQQTKQHIQQIFERQKTFEPATKASDRKHYLKKLAASIRANEENIKEALRLDLRKHPTEAYLTEIYPVLNEIQLFLGNLSSWLRPQKVANNLVFTGSDASLQLEPKGRCLIIAPWNYPFQLPLLHLVACVAAGNTAIIKPSEFTKHAATVLKKVIDETFAPEHVTVIEGDQEVASALLSLPFDHIHFTGSTKVGKIVMKAAAEHLASCTLELGGKSPFIIDNKVNMKTVAQKLVLGKFVNLGQTCIAPDYVLVPTNRKDEFVAAMKDAITKAFGADIQACKDLSRIVNISHHQRLVDLLKEARAGGAVVAFGGEYDVSDLYIEPTLITDVPQEAKLLEEEIFGPILPIITFDKIADAKDFILKRPKPLAMYLFTHQQQWIDYFNQHTSAGALVINDVMVHIMHPNLPFGGVNHSGMGQSTGYFGLKDFSHEKPILKANPIVTPTAVMNFPYKDGIEKLLQIMV